MAQSISATTSFFWICGRILSRHISFANDGQPGNTTAANETEAGYRAIRRELDIQKCLAKPVESFQVLVSNVLLLAVLLCVVIKIATCATILGFQQDVSLVTPGDAIESFITDPDIYTRGLATLSLKDSQSLHCSRRKVLTESLVDGKKSAVDCALSFVQQAWIQVYFPCFTALSGLFIVWVISRTSPGKSPLGNFGPSENVTTINLMDGLGYLSTLICVNMPQLILSFVYLTISMLHTQLQVEKEWNFLFILIIDGRSDLKGSINEHLRTDFRLPENTFVGTGYSDLSILILLILGSIFVLSPLLS
ncbi:hypothetical protein PG994_002390 [Apiospora phragmitis]|uniref:Uncharacterized protein n=1 Tax=Apiospora phragmitis TaxID=2905665 RepID=A0ABR1WW77_9PEZI